MTTVAATMQARDYPDHKCPDSLQRHGDERPGFHGPAGGSLLMACYVPTACGCDVTGNGTLMHPVLIEPCDAHRSAMYPSLVRETVPA